MSTYNKEYLQNLITEVYQTSETDTGELLKDLLTEHPFGKRYLEAPASTSARRHGAYVGGLLDHGITVYKVMARIVESSAVDSEFSKIYGGITKTSMLNVALLHDLFKAGDGVGNPYYVENILKSGKPSEAQPYKRNDAVFSSYDQLLKEKPYSEMEYFANNGKIGGHKSLARVKEESPKLYEALTEDEKGAIIYYAGAYETDPIYMQNKETNLQMLLHYADMFASRNVDLQLQTNI